MLGVLNMIFLALSNLGAVSECAAPLAGGLPAGWLAGCLPGWRPPSLLCHAWPCDLNPSCSPFHIACADLLSIIDVAANERAVLYRERASGQYSAATCGCHGRVTGMWRLPRRVQPG